MSSNLYLQWITLFDEMAEKIVGKPAEELAGLRESGDEREFRKILNLAKYRRFEFFVKTTMETWNDENRLRITVQNADPVDYSQSGKYISRIKDEIERLPKH